MTHLITVGSTKFHPQSSAVSGKVLSLERFFEKTNAGLF
jgi:hypothetical protein